MSHATIYVDQERVLDFVHQRLEAGDDDPGILRAGASWDALGSLGHVITDQDLIAAVRYVRLVLDDGAQVPDRAVDCIAYLRRILSARAA
jgi:hypothetical protein